MNSVLLLAVVAIAVLAPQVAAAPDKIVCYWESWAIYRTGTGRHTIDDIDPYLCTHLQYGFAGATADGNIRIDDSWADLDLGGYTNFNALKQQNPNLKTLISVGGWNEGSEVFSIIAADPDLRDIFATNAANFLLQYGFDGFDLDWEYPAQRGGADSDYTNFVELLWALRAQLEPHGFLLTAACGAAVANTDTTYDLGRMRDVLDYVNLMTYDFHGSWEYVTGANAPLYAKSNEADQSNNINAAVQNWLNLGFPAEKIVLGIGAYGHTWALSDPNNHDIGASATGPGAAGPVTQSQGTLGYMEICVQDWDYGWDAEQIVVYAWRDNQWVGFDNADSVGYRTQYAIDNNLGGLMVWSLDTDDAFALCGSTYPIVNAIRNTLGWN